MKQKFAGSLLEPTSGTTGENMPNRKTAGPRAAVAAAVGSIVAGSGVAIANPGDQYILPIDHFLQGNGFVPEGNTGYNGSQAWSHAYTGPGDTSRVYWKFNNPGVPTDARLYIVEWWDATPGGSDGWQPIESQFNGDAGETYPIESQIPWSGEYGTNHQYIGAESQAISGGTWRLAGAGPHTPDGYSYNADSDGNGSFYMWLKAGSQLYAKWDFGFAIANGDPRTWAELRLTEVTPTPVTVYWDLNGNTAGTGGGGGGTTPSGNWNGTSPNFNTDAGGAGTPTSIRAATNAVDTVIFSAGSGATGAYTVSVSGTRMAALVSFEEGTVTLNGGNLAVGAFSAPAGVNATVTSVVSGLGSGVLKSGDGTIAFSAANTFTGGMTVTGGTLVLANADATAGGAINVADGALAQAQAGLPKAVTVTTLATNTSGKFDLTNNSMVVKAMTSGQVRSLIVPAYNAGAWNGPTGLTSSTAAAGTSTGIGYADNSILGLTNFKGVDVAPADVLVKYTYYGDADLDGDVDGNDVGRWAVNFTGSGGGTLNIANAQPEAVAMLEAMGFTVVPEPTGLAVLGTGAAAGLLGRRRRVRRN
jgi:autotransporter-associated beta strand protein